MTQVQPATHEFDGWFNFAPLDTHPNAMVDYDGLAPYWAVSELLIEHADGFHELETAINGEAARIELTYSRSGFPPAPDHDVDSDRLYEFGVNVELSGERKVHYNLSPRFPDQRNSDGEPASLAWDHLEPQSGVAVRVESANVDLEELRTLLPAALHELADDLDTSLFAGYFQQPFSSRVTALERYVRYRRELQQKIIGTGRIMDRLASHLSDSAGTAGSRQWDNEDVRGHYHTLKFDSRGASLLVDRHEFGGQLKSYLPREPDSFDPDDPLYHPKLGAKFISGENKRGAVDWSEVRDVVDELDERLLSVLSWSDVSTESGGTTYVPDDHFRAEGAASPVPLHRDPLPELDAREDLLLVDALQDMTPTHSELIQDLVTDGGRHVQELAEDVDTSESTVYRFLDNFQEILESDNGYVEWTSRSVRKKLEGVVDDLDQHLDSALERVGRLVDLDQYQRASSAFDQWLADNAAEFRAPEDSGEPVVEIERELTRSTNWSDLPSVQDVLEEMLDAWARDGRDRRELRHARVIARVGGESVELIPSATVDEPMF